MKRQAIWNDIREKMSGKRTRNDAVTARKNKKSSAPHDIIVQRLTSEPESREQQRRAHRERPLFPTSETINHVSVDSGQTLPPGEVLPIILGASVPPGPENPYPISDQTIRFSILYFRHMTSQFAPYFRQTFRVTQLSCLLFIVSGSVLACCFLVRVFIFSICSVQCPRRHVNAKIVPYPRPKGKIHTLFQTRNASK